MLTINNKRWCFRSVTRWLPIANLKPKEQHFHKCWACCRRRSQSCCWRQDRRRCWNVATTQLRHRFASSQVDTPPDSTAQSIRAHASETAAPLLSNPSSNTQLPKTHYLGTKATAELQTVQGFTCVCVLKSRGFVIYTHILPWTLWICIYVIDSPNPPWQWFATSPRKSISMHPHFNVDLNFKRGKSRSGFCIEVWGWT